MAKKSLVILFPDTNSENAYLQQLNVFLGLENDASFRLHAAQSIMDLEAEVENSEHSIAIFNLRNKSDLIEVLNFLGTQQQKIKNHQIRVIGSSELKHPNVVKVLIKRGCADILPLNLTQKTLKYKISQSFKILENYHRQQAELLKDAEEVRFRLAQASQGPDLALKNSQMSPALKMWIESEKGPVFVNSVEYSDREVIVEAPSVVIQEGQRIKFVIECGTGAVPSQLLEPGFVPAIL